MKLAVYVTGTCEQPAVCRDDFYLPGPAVLAVFPSIPYPGLTHSLSSREVPPWITGSPAHPVTAWLTVLPRVGPIGSAPWSQCPC